MPAGIVLTGGSSQLKNITKTANNMFGVAARVGYPSGLTGMTEEISSPSFSCVQGLVKHAMEDVNMGGNAVESSGGEGGNAVNKVVDWFKSLLP